MSTAGRGCPGSPAACRRPSCSPPPRPRGESRRRPSCWTTSSGSGDRWTVCLTSLAIGAVYAHLDQPELAHAYAPAGRGGRGRARRAGAPGLGAACCGPAVAVRVGEPAAEQQAARPRSGRPRGWASVTPRRWRSGSRRSRSPEPGAPTGCGRPTRVIAPTESSGVTLRCLGGFSLAAAGVELPWRELRPRVRALLMLLAMNHGPSACTASGWSTRCGRTPRSRRVSAACRWRCPASGSAWGGRDHRGCAAPATATRTRCSSRRCRTSWPTSSGSPTRPDRRTGPTALRRRMAALAAYTGDLLPEVGPAEWAVEERARLRLLAASVGSKRPGMRWPPGNCAIALDAARRSVALDPLPRLVLAAGGRDQRTARATRAPPRSPGGNTLRCGPISAWSAPGRVTVGRRPAAPELRAGVQRCVQNGRVIVRASSPSGVSTSPSLTRVSHRSRPCAGRRRPTSGWR